MAVDLHLHSIYSDGTYEPAVIVEMAVARGLSAIALTDHDGFEGIDEARQAAEGRIDFIPGVELSIEWQGRGVHLLGYWIDAGSRLDAELAAIRTSREERNLQIIEALNELGYPITVEEVQAISGPGVIGRPHIAEALMNHGVVDAVSEAFDRFLTRGRPAYRDRLRLTMEHAVELIHEGGGLASIAHPHTIADESDDFRSAVGQLAGLGVDGVECWYSEYPETQRRDLAAWATSLGLIATGGSDHHGPKRKPGIDVGVGRGDLIVPDEVVEHLTRRLTDR